MTKMLTFLSNVVWVVFDTCVFESDPLFFLKVSVTEWFFFVGEQGGEVSSRRLDEGYMVIREV